MEKSAGKQLGSSAHYLDKYLRMLMHSNTQLQISDTDTAYVRQGKPTRPRKIVWMYFL